MIVNKLIDNGKLLDGVSANTTGSLIKFSKYDEIVFHVVAASVTTGATVVIERSLDGTNFVQVSSTAVSANGVTEVTAKNEPALYYRASVSSYTDGTYTVVWNAA